MPGVMSPLRRHTGRVTAFWCDDPRDVLFVTGADSLTYLQSQISQDIRNLADGASAYTFVLQPTGKVDALARITRRSAEVFVLDTDLGFGAALAARLNRFKIRVKVDIAVADASCIAVRGVAADAGAAIAGGVPAWGLESAFDVVTLAGDGDAEPPAGVRAGTSAELQLARIEAGWPAMGDEITDATIPAESGVVPFAVNFTKGCYPGQELVERMDSRGSQAPRFVRRLRAVGDSLADVPAVGAELSHDGKTVGLLTSVSATADGWVALGVVARSVHPGDMVTVGADAGSNCTATVEDTAR